jgi:hypothetical protein
MGLRAMPGHARVLLVLRSQRGCPQRVSSSAQPGRRMHGQRSKQRLVEAFVAQLAVEGLWEVVPRRAALP